MFAYFKEYHGNQKKFYEFIWFLATLSKIRDVCMDFEPYFKVHNLVSVHPKSIIVGQMTNLNMIFYVVVSVSSGHEKEKQNRGREVGWRSLNIPPGIPRALDAFSCPGGREFDEYSLPRARHLITTHRGWGIWSLASISTCAINLGRAKPWCIQSERYPIRGGLAEKQRLAQTLLRIWRYSRTICIIFGM